MGMLEYAIVCSVTQRILFWQMYITEMLEYAIACCVTQRHLSCDKSCTLQ